MKGLRWFIRLTFTIWNYRLQSSWHDASFRRLSDKLFTILSRLDVDAWVCVDVDATFVWRLIESLIQNTNSSVREYCRFAPLQQNILACRIATLVKSVQNKCVCITKKYPRSHFRLTIQTNKSFRLKDCVHIPRAPLVHTYSTRTANFMVAVATYIYKYIIHTCVHMYICIYMYINIYICKLYLPYRFPTERNFWEGL